MPILSRPLPPVLTSDSDGFSYTQSGSNSPNHYHDIESLKLTLGKPKSGRKNSREKSTIWTQSFEVEKERTTNNNSTTGHKKVKSNNNSTLLSSSTSKPKSCKKGDKENQPLSSPGRFLENPLLLQTVDQNWTLPRVELWCRSPDCAYNQQLWGNHYTYQHNNIQNPSSHYSSGSSGGGGGGKIVIPEVDEAESEEVYHTDQTLSTGYCTRSSNNSSSSGSGHHTNHQNHNYDIHTAATMVLNPQGGGGRHHHNGLKNNAGGPGQSNPTLTAREQMHLNMSMGINNFGAKDGITITHTNTTTANSKADDNNITTFTNNTNSTSTNTRLRGKGNSGGADNNNGMTMTQTPKIGSSISSSSSNSTTATDSSTILTIHTESTTGSSNNNGSGGILGLGGESTSSSTNRSSEEEGFSVPSTFLTGFDSSTSSSNSTTGSGAGSSAGLCKPVGHDIVNLGGNHRNNNGNAAQCLYNTTTNPNSSNTGQYNNQNFRPPANPYCPNCSGVVPLNHLDNNGLDQGVGGGKLKGDPGFWQFNKFQHPLQRDHSFHSVGGFTLNGQYNATVKKNTMVKFCSSHKISLVVSTFSLLVTIGLLITLFLMKKRGMMDTMMDS